MQKIKLKISERGQTEYVNGEPDHVTTKVHFWEIFVNDETNQELRNALLTDFSHHLCGLKVEEGEISGVLLWENDSRTIERLSTLKNTIQSRTLQMAGIQ